MTTKAYLMRILTIGLGLSAARIAVLWFLIHREWGHQQSITFLPLIVLLYPEGLLLPPSFSWSLGRAIGFSAVLLFGSFLLTAVFFVAIRELKL